MGAIASPRGLRRIFLPQTSRQAIELLLKQYPGNVALREQPLGDLPFRLRRYLNGELVTFPDALDLTGTTPFQQSTWQVVGSIPYSETRSYGWLACQLGKPKASRAVGQAMAQNPLPIIIPCHRVIAGNGELGGFSGGRQLKRHLLDMESQFANTNSH